MNTYQQTPQNPPSYNSVMQRMNSGFNHSLRPLAIFVSFIGMIYCVVRGASLLKDSGDSAPELKTADIVLGAVYVALGLFQLTGIVIAVRKRARSVALYAKAIIAGGVVVSALEIAALVVHVKLKEESKEHCRSGLADEEDQNRVSEWCDSDWKRGVWVHAIWMAVIIVLASIFIALWWRFKKQVQTNAYQVPKDNVQHDNTTQLYPMQPNLRYAPTLDYTSSQNQPDYVPPYTADAVPPYDAKDYRDDKEFQDVDFERNNNAHAASSSSLNAPHRNDNVV